MTHDEPSASVAAIACRTAAGDRLVAESGGVFAPPASGPSRAAHEHLVPWAPVSQVCESTTTSCAPTAPEETQPGPHIVRRERCP
jgi:hypothetical protein